MPDEPRILTDAEVADFAKYDILDTDEAPECYLSATQRAIVFTLRHWQGRAVEAEREIERLTVERDDWQRRSREDAELAVAASANLAASLDRERQMRAALDRAEAGEKGKEGEL